jgi:excisionase family DNA binding protein
MAQQLMKDGGLTGGTTPPPLPGSTTPATSGGGGAPGGFDLLSPGEAAQLLGVSEGDVLATIQEGALKAKKIGSTYRITRGALEEFLKE